ncbi:hypothetical protein [Breoghania sp.]|uniref:hypothetical protein n=1 Tax=Breoghania sp. TaxID=2065378 RepID=UPI0029C9C5B3|nr:hypothetical protein [Breoghania sp.]
MVDQSLMTLKVRSYLGALSRNACDMLIRNLEASRERGDLDPQFELILEAARPLLRKRAFDNQPRAHRRNLLKRAIFLPLEPFLIAEQLPRKLPGRILRSTLDPMWIWLDRDVMPESIAEAQELLAKEDYDAEVVGRTAERLRGLAVSAIADVLDEAEGPGVARQRVAYRVGGEPVLNEFSDIYGILKADPVLEGFSAQLPPVLTRRSFASGDAAKAREQVVAAIRNVVEAHPEYVGWISAILLWRCDDPVLLVRMAAGAAGIAKPQTIQSSLYAGMVDTALSELRRYVLMAQGASSATDTSDLDHGVEWQSEAVVVAISRYHDQLRELRAGIDLRDVSQWRNEMVEINRDMAEIIAREISAAHRQVHAALEVPEPDETGQIKPNPMAAAIAYRTLRVLYIACKNPDLLGVSDAVIRSRRAIEQVLDMASKSLVDELRNAVGPRREALKDSLERVVSYASIVFGHDYVEILKKRCASIPDIEKRPLAS